VQAYGNRTSELPSKKKRNLGDASSDEDEIGESRDHLTHFESGAADGTMIQGGESEMSEVSSQARGTAPLVIRESLKGQISGGIRAARNGAQSGVPAAN